MLKINYCLSLDIKTPTEEVREKLKALYSYCANHPFSEVSPVQDFVKVPIKFLRHVVPEEIIGFKFRLAAEGEVFALKLMKFPNIDRAPQVWYCDESIWMSKEVPASLYMIKYRAFIEAMDEAKRIGFNVGISDEGGYWEGRSLDVLVSAIKRDRDYTDPRDVIVR